MREKTSKRLRLLVKSGKPATVDFGIESELPDSEEIDIKNSKLIFVSTNEIRCEKDFRTISDIMENANFKGKMNALQINHQDSKTLSFDKLHRLLNTAHFIFLSSKCARRIFGANILDDRTYRDLVKILKFENYDERFLILTQASHPTLVINGPDITEYPINQLPADSILDSIGCNDAFIGAFLSQIIDVELITPNVLENALQAAHWAKRELLKWNGAQFPRWCGFYAWRSGTRDYSHRCEG